MKQGNQFYLEIQVLDENDSFLNIDGVAKAQFNIGEITKIYDGVNLDVTYDNEKQVFKVYLTEGETFEMKDVVKIDCRILFKNNLIEGSYVYNINVYDSVKEELLDVETETN